MRDEQWREYIAWEERLKSPEQKELERLIKDVNEITEDCYKISELEGHTITYDLLCEWVLKTEIKILSQVISSDKVLTCGAWKSKQIVWLKTLVTRYKTKYEIKKDIPKLEIKKRVSVIYDCDKCGFYCLTVPLSEDKKVCPVCGSRLVERG